MLPRRDIRHMQPAFSRQKRDDGERALTSDVQHFTHTYKRHFCNSPVSFVSSYSYPSQMTCRGITAPVDRKRDLGMRLISLSIPIMPLFFFFLLPHLPHACLHRADVLLLAHRNLLLHLGEEQTPRTKQSA